LARLSHGLLRLPAARLGLVDQDGGTQALKIREAFDSVRANMRTFLPVYYTDQKKAMKDVRNGKIEGAVIIPPQYSRRVYEQDRPQIALVVILILTPFLRPITDILPVFGGENDFLGGLVAFLAALGAIAAMATRVPQESRLEQRPQGDVPVRIWLVGPFIGAVGIVAGDALDRMGLPGGDLLIGVAVIVAVASFVLANRLPVVSRNTRRQLDEPMRPAAKPVDVVAAKPLGVLPSAASPELAYGIA
jgi:hypothetical protein